MEPLFEKHLTYLFFGDSITDAGRNREDGANLGAGFVYFLAAELQRQRPDMFMKIFNRGIGGHALHNLLERLDRDCIALRPDIVTVQCGVNDATYRDWPSENGIPVTPDVFRYRYEQIITRIRTGLPQSRLILMTPFLHRITGEHYLNQKLVYQFGEIVTELAKKHDCVLVPLGQLFGAEFDAGRAPLYTMDGAHPTPLGARCIAEYWWQYVREAGGPYWEFA